MDTQDMAEIAKERGKEVGKLLDGGARLEPTLEQVEKARGEMNVEIEKKLTERLEGAFKEKKWDLAEDILKMLKAGDQKSLSEEESLQEDLEPSVDFIDKSPRILDYKKVFSVEDHLEHNIEVEEVKNDLEEVRNILGERLSSFYKLMNLSVEELSSLSASFKGFYNSDGTEKENFQENLFQLIEEYMPARNYSYSVDPKNSVRYYRDDFYLRHDLLTDKKLIRKFRSRTELMITDPLSEEDIKLLSNLIVLDMNKSDKDIKLFFENITDSTRSKEEILTEESEKVLITEYVLFQASKERFRQQREICLSNAQQIFKFSKNHETLENEQSKIHKNEIKENLMELENYNTGVNRDALDKSIKGYMSSIKSYTS